MLELERAPPQIQVPIALMMFTGLRKGDVLVTAKTSEDLVLAVHPDLGCDPARRSISG